MSSYPKNISLQDGSEIILRLFTNKDKTQLEQFFKDLPIEDRLYLKEDITSASAAERWVEDLDHNNIYPLVITLKNKLIACGKLKFFGEGWMRNIAETRIIVAKEYQKQGLGAIILAELVKKATEKNLKKIEVLLSSQQIGAIKAFERMGFRIEATLTKYIIDLNGQESNLVIMTIDVNELWNQMEDILFEYDVNKFD
jgi:L-amino acid N-acyltransferase YncA